MSDPVQPSPTDLPSDPLLKPGAFIDANRQSQSAEPTKTGNGSIPTAAQLETPGPGFVKSLSSADPKVNRRVVAPESWLPPGWLVEDRVRSSGATAGLVDRYYFEPSSGRRFRSKKEVLYFLETGSPQPKRKKGSEASSSEGLSSGNSSGNKQKKSTKKPKPLNFDFANVPEKVDWLMTDACADYWTAFIGNEVVPQSTRQDWAAVFSSLIASKSSQAMF
ncbi:Detected protein of confused Function [Hibiscus syriacus]|uniref:Detected protein of confused Function n=1 Tax=Hibiscus syriacus TaxID=106335 RepID=A0A6A3CEC8_HIBSY|nr:methyl-CpG-binding domain-containing protein 5-like [Hibiscus syriacus]KAE8727685.1 Detected protein of confused Function [Hibiscus syriacus]